MTARMEMVPLRWIDASEIPARRPRDWWGIAALLVGAAFLLRSGQFGNPIKGLDEQYYLLVGDRLLHGALPYVDLWDRKPYGLFLLFAGIRLLGGNGVVQAQIVATLFAAATALIVTAIAARSAARTPAVLAGIAYLIAIQIIWGGATQTPVFYNLLTAASVWLVLNTAPALDRTGDTARVLAAMLLAGAAIQIKLDVAIEGAMLGVWITWRLWRTVPHARTCGMALAMVWVALLPTIAVAAYYAAIGHFDAFWFANFQSQLLKHGGLSPVAGARALQMASLTAPMIALLLAGLWQATAGLRRWTPELQLLALWALAAAVDAVAIGGFWAHYALPLAVPAAILSAQIFAHARLGWIVFGVFAVYPAVDGIVLDRISAADERAIATATVAAIPRDVTTRCLLVYEGPSIYYHLTHACLVTRFAFSDHLRSSAEADALGEDASLALRAALDRRPGTILTVEGSDWPERNRTNDRIIAAETRRHYTAIARLPHSHNRLGAEWVVIWRRNDLGSARALVRQL